MSKALNSSKTLLFDGLADGYEFFENNTETVKNFFSTMIKEKSC